MITIIAGPNKFTGSLKNFEFSGGGSEGIDMIVRMELGMDTFIECKFPRIPELIKTSMTKIGLHNLKNSTVNLTSMNIKLDEKIAKVENSPIRKESKPLSGLVLGGGM